MDPASLGYELTKNVVKTGEKGFISLIDALFQGKISINNAKNTAKAKIEEQKIQMDWEKFGKNQFERSLQIKYAENKYELDNLESVSKKIIPKLTVNSSIKDQKIDNLKLLFDEAKGISDEDMQEYLAINNGR